MKFLAFIVLIKSIKCSFLALLKSTISKATRSKSVCFSSSYIKRNVKVDFPIPKSPLIKKTGTNAPFFRLQPFEFPQ